MSRPYFPGLLAVLLFCLSCTVGDYEVTPCDPDVKNLSLDICNQVNLAQHLTGCMVYQCDRGSKSCKLSTLDYDRDGDPDPTCPGGTDCNDYDATVKGSDGTCGCNPLLVGMACYVGVGACQAKATYQCRPPILYCTTPVSPIPGNTYTDKPEPKSGSWDWNCNGALETQCMIGSQLTACPPANCDNATIKGAIASGQNDSACDTYCKGLASSSASCNAAAPQTFVCDPSCGQPVVTCHCAAPLLICQRSTTVATDVSKVLCK